MCKKVFGVLFFLASGLLGLGGETMAESAETRAAIAEVAKTLDAFHAAASKADGTTYFGLFAPEGIFIGTDATERWTVSAFKEYAMPFFAKGKGWTYTPGVRHIDLVPGGETAWFDELLNNKSYGECRGTGVLRKISGSWKVAQYHLTIPVPNDLADTVVKMIRDGKKAPPKTSEAAAKKTPEPTTK